MSDIDTNPATLLVDNREGPVTLTCDWTADLPQGVTVSSAVCTITALDDGSDTPGGLSGSATVATPVITQKIAPGGLTPGRQYILKWTATLSNSDVIVKRTTITVARP